MKDFLHLVFPEEKAVSATCIMVGFYENSRSDIISVDNMTFGMFSALEFTDCTIQGL